jgi:hypothetical protein
MGQVCVVTRLWPESEANSSPRLELVFWHEVGGTTFLSNPDIAVMILKSHIVTH